MSIHQSGRPGIRDKQARHPPCRGDSGLSAPHLVNAIMTHIRHISHIHHINRAACHPIPPIVPIVPTHTSRALRTRPTYPLRAPQRTKKHFQSAPRGYSLTFRLQKFAILLIQCLLSVLTVPQFCKVVSSFGGGEGVFLGYFQKKGMGSHPPYKGV